MGRHALADEGPDAPGSYGPYRQSETFCYLSDLCGAAHRAGHAYYAFDTPRSY